MGGIQIIQGVECFEKDGVAYLRLETVAHGLGFTTVAKSGNEVIRWQRVFQYLCELGAVTTSGHDKKISYQAMCPDYIPENVFYRLAMKAKNAAAESFQAKVADEIIPAIRKTGTYSAKTLTAAELILCQAQQLVEQEKRVMLLESHAKEQDARLDELEARTTTRPEIYYTIAGYWKKMGHILTTNEAAALGKKASNICRALGCVKRKVDDEKYGTVGSYPIHILKTVYENWLCEPTTF